MFGGGEGLGGGVEFCSLEGKIASPSFVGINGGLYKTPRKQEKAPLHFCPLPRFWLPWVVRDLALSQASG